MGCCLGENIYEVGYVDWTVRDFHSYVTDRGVTYNSYLILDEQVALIDAVKAPYWEYLLKNVAAYVDPAQVRYVVCNHAEPDHSGGLEPLLKRLPNAEVVCDAKCKEILGGYYDTADWKFRIIKTGEVIKLGKRSLQFIETPMVHWPDSLFTYVPEEQILFSMDAFGQHYASSNKFDFEVPLDEVMAEAKTYYANIVMPYGQQVKKVLEAAAGLPIKTVAPSHGIIWRKHLPVIVEAYQRWCVCKPAPKVVILYDSMWESTGKMAREIYEAACRPGLDVKLLHIRSVGNTKLVAECLDAACIAVGSSTLNQAIMPAAASALTYLRGLRPTGKAGFAFGSFGWGKGGPEEAHEYLQSMKFELLREPLKAKWRPDAAVLEECRKMGDVLAEKALALAAQA